MPESNFVDHVRIMFRSGNGGAGSLHFLRNKLTSKGGPDGGNGGRGGHIILRGNKNLWTLLHLKYQKHIFAGNGHPGSGQMKTGADGKDVSVDVPLGTIVKNPENNEFVCEITAHGQEVILLKGGRGGMGNAFFKSATMQTPRFAQPGEPGIERLFILELKILADVGLVGFPNAGKSTLLSVISAAKPKIADYPFTTLTPNLGIVHYRDNRSFIMADIPGIIEGAHMGKGLGLRFLRHIERNSVLLFMVPCDSKKTIFEEYNILLNELERYNPELLHKKRVLAVTKIDMVDDNIIEELQQEIPKDIPVVFISAVAEKNMQQLKDLLWNAINAL